MANDDLYVALIHFPVMNKKNHTIASALTTIDMHDIARASITFGVKGFYIVTPYDDQAELAEKVIEHWTKGVGGKLNPFRKDALELIRVSKTFEDMIASIEAEKGQKVVTIATSAKKTERTLAITALQQMREQEKSHVLVFGTAWGLADELLDKCHFTLDPIYGVTDYNHLSVRSAVSIYLDRIINGR